MVAGKKSCEFIGMLHIHINTILSAPSKWRIAHNLPVCSSSDWKEIDELEHLFSKRLNNEALGPVSVFSDHDFLSELEDRTKRLSITKFLIDRLLEEADLYQRYGVTSMMIENIAAPYFVRGRQPVVIVAMMSLLARRLRAAYPNARLGVQLLAFSCDLALGIGLRNQFNFIRSEAALFNGTRPEGHMSNQGNLATLYAIRNRWESLNDSSNRGPLVYVDVKKKHTHFMPVLTDLNVWLENLIFQKLEGIILTGRATGKAIDENELIISREYIEKTHNELKKKIGEADKPKLIVGSGVNVDNITAITKCADAIIVGSSMKTGGYWENPLDEQRLAKLVDAL